MFALSLALLLAIPAPEAPQAVQPVLRKPQAVAPAQEVARQVLALIPEGTAMGSWASVPLYEEGFLVALVKDAAGRPLYALKASLSGTGKVSGRLHPLEYAGNPALLLADFSVVGSAQIPAEGPGTFSLMIFNPLEDGFQPYPRGSIDGLLLRGLRPMVKPGQTALFGAQQLAPATAQEPSLIRGAGVHVGDATELATALLRQGVIVCPHAPAATLSAATGMGTMSQASGLGKPWGVVVCPYEPSFSLSELSAMGPAGSAGHVLTSSTQPFVSGQTAMGSLNQAGFVIPAEGEGVVAARWHLLP